MIIPDLMAEHIYILYDVISTLVSNLILVPVMCLYMYMYVYVFSWGYLYTVAMVIKGFF